MARLTMRKHHRDPKAPTPNKSAWRLFFDDNREELRKQHPNMSYHEISKKLGEMWQQRDEGTSRRYEQQYQTGQAEYDEKMAVYREERKQKKSNSQKNRDQSKKENSKNNNDEQS